MEGNSKEKYIPIRNRAGRFVTKTFVNRPGSTDKMKTITPIKVKGKKFKRRTLDTPRIGKKTSVVWHFFKALPHENGIARAVCLLCKVVFKNPGGSTTGMRGHLDRKHPDAIGKVIENQHFKVETKPRASFPMSKAEGKVERRSVTPPPPHLSIENGAIGAIGETEIFEQESMSVLVDIDGEQPCTSTSKRKRHILPGPPPEVYSVTDTDEITKSIVLYLASTMQPLHKVDDANFRKMIYNLNSSYIVEAGSLDGDSVFGPVVSTLNDLYKEIKDDTKRKIQEKYLSLSLELWVKTNSEIYVLVTANYINRDWNHEYCFLGIRQLLDTCLITHPDVVSEKISSVVSTILEEYEIKTEYIVHVLLHSFPFSLNSNILSLTTWPCLNDTVRRSYDMINEYAVSATNCDLLGNALKIGKQVLPSYKEVKKHPGKLMGAMKIFLSSHSTDNLPLKVEDLEECILLQDPFNVIVDTLLEQPVMSVSSVLPLIYFIRSIYETQVTTGTSSWSKEQRQETTNAICNQIETSYKINASSNDFGDSMLAVCAFLDPRYKKLRFLTIEQRDHIYETVIELLHELGKGKTPNSDTGSIVSVRSENPAYNNINGNVTVTNNTTDPLNPSNTTPNQTTPGQSSKLAAMLSSIVGKRPIELPSSDSMEELTNYWDEPVAPISMDPFQWWHYNHERFPKLAELAKRYLCIRATSTYARLNFTGAGKTFYDLLGNIEPEFLEKLQVLRRYHSLNAEVTETISSQITVEDQLDIKAEAEERVELMEEL